MKPLFSDRRTSWGKLQEINNQRFTCGYCGADVSTNKGYPLFKYYKEEGIEEQIGGIFICPNCQGPNFIDSARHQYPAPPMGDSVENVPEKIRDLYDEARMSTSASCYTGATLLSRKLLMHIAVDKGAEEGKSYTSYVDFLNNEGYVPKTGEDWVDTIRNIGNDANHEISEVSKEGTKQLLTFVYFLLKNIYDLPSKAEKYQSSPDN